MPDVIAAASGGLVTLDEVRVRFPNYDQLVSQNGKLWVLHARPEYSDPLVLVKKPGMAIWDIYKKKMADEIQRANAQRWLLETLKVAPSNEDVASMLDDLPGLIDTWGVDLHRIAGWLLGEHRAKF